MTALSAVTRIHPTTRIEAHDFLDGEHRLVGIEFDGLTIGFGIYPDDAEILETTGLLVGALAVLRNAAAERMKAALLATVEEIAENELRALAGDR